ncbi:MAG: flagellar assembly protein FliH, partial [Rubrivivax sp.]
EEGYRDGLVALEGFKKSHSAQVSAQVGQLVQSFDAQWTQLEARMAESVARSAVLLARQVLRSELAVQPELVGDVAREAVNAVMMSARQIVVRVHPDDLALVAQGAEDALKARGARLEPDASIQRGGCQVESDAGSIDATLQARWERAAQSMGQAVAFDADEPSAGRAP